MSTDPQSPGTYTPTTAEMRERCIDYDEMRAEVLDRQEAEFDRWLAAHDAEVIHLFIDQHIHNGAPGKGQALYNEGGNPWLHQQIEG